MVGIDTKDPKWIVKFKKKEQRANRIDDKFEIFRHIVGLQDTNDIFNIQRFTGTHQGDPIIKTKSTVTDDDSYELPLVIARLSSDQVERLRQDPNIDEVIESVTTYMLADAGHFPAEPPPSATVQNEGWWFKKVKAREAFAVSSKKGQGVKVAVIDTGGFPTHEDLTPVVEFSQSFLDGDSSVIAADGAKHGTHVQGIIGMQDNNLAYVGTAPGCRIWNLRAGDANGGFSGADWTEAAEYARNNNAHIVNQSIATSSGFNWKPGYQIVADSIKLGYDGKGIIYNSALGNQAILQSDTFPAVAYGSFGISNIQQDLNLSHTSNAGANVDFCHPGHDILSTINNNLYINHDGTSMATPCFSGICALALAEWNPGGGGAIYNTGNKAKNTVIFAAAKLAANKNGKFTTEWDSRFGFGMPEANKLVSILKEGCA